MKINEVMQPSERALFEALDAENDTGIATGDVVNLIKSLNGPVEGPFTGDEMIARIYAAAAKNGIAL